MNLSSSHLYRVSAFFRYFAISLLLLNAGSVASAQISTSQKITPLKVGAPRGLGPLQVPYNQNTVAGAAFVFGGSRPDLFIRGKSHSSGNYLFKYLRDDEHGAPIFAPAIPFISPFEDRDCIFQTRDGKVHSFGIIKNEVGHAVFDQATSAFVEQGRIPLPPALKGAQNLVVFVNANGTFDLAFDLSGDSTPDRLTEKNPSSVDFRPYDAAGISTLGSSWHYLMAASMPSLTGPIEDAHQLSPSTREVSMNMVNLAALFFGPGHRGIATGSRFGNFSYYPAEGESGLPATLHLLLAGLDGNALRSPNISPGIVAYPRRDGVTDFVSGGEYGVLFYKFTGRFLPNGAPVFESPINVLQEDADLYVGALPTLSVVDWDGDGVTDIVAGNASGFILFLKNIGTNDAPGFLPGVRIQAEGRDIQHQAGYSGSIQGLHEARWGYIGPNAIDWNGDGLPDIVVSDITGNYTVYINRGTKAAPKLEAQHPIYCDGIDLHGMWRCRPGVVKIGGRTALLTVDGEDAFHLYWRIDDYNVEDGGKLALADGSPITASIDAAGGTGRVKFDFFDVDADGKPDLVIGTGRRSAIPNQQTGYPLPVLGKKALGTPLFMKNMGMKNGRPVFAAPMPFAHSSIGLVQPGGGHETGAVGTTLGGGKFNLLLANQSGNVFLLKGTDLKFLTPAEAATYYDKPNPFPGSTR